MRQWILIAMVATLISCGTAGSTGTPAGSGSAGRNITYGGGDGLSCETRVLIRGARSSFDGVPAEYAWIKRKYPGAKARGQALADCAGLPADQISITTAEGKNVSIYFDISDFFGKGF